MDNSTKEESAYGVTSRMIAKHMEEHKKDIELARLNTLLAVEAYNKDISIDWKKVVRIKPVLDRTQPTVTKISKNIGGGQEKKKLSTIEQPGNLPRPGNTL